MGCPPALDCGWQGSRPPPQLPKVVQADPRGLTPPKRSILCCIWRHFRAGKFGISTKSRHTHRLSHPALPGTAARGGAARGGPPGGGGGGPAIPSHGSAPASRPWVRTDGEDGGAVPTTVFQWGWQLSPLLTQSFLPGRREGGEGKGLPPGASAAGGNRGPTAHGTRHTARVMAGSAGLFRGGMGRTAAGQRHPRWRGAGGPRGGGGGGGGKVCRRGGGGGAVCFGLRAGRGAGGGAVRI